MCVIYFLKTRVIFHFIRSKFYNSIYVIFLLYRFYTNIFRIISITYYLCSYFSYFFISQYLTHISKKKIYIFNKFLFSPWIGSKLMSLPIGRLSEMTDEMQAEILQISRIGIFANLVETIILT